MHVQPPPSALTAESGYGQTGCVGTTLPDSSGNRNNGTLAGNATYGEGRPGQAFVFDGSYGAVTLGNPVNLRLQTFTIEAWMRRASSSIITAPPYTTAPLMAYGYAGYG